MDSTYPAKLKITIIMLGLFNNLLVPHEFAFWVIICFLAKQSFFGRANAISFFFVCCVKPVLKNFH